MLAANSYVEKVFIGLPAHQGVTISLRYIFGDTCKTAYEKVASFLLTARTS